MKDKKNKTDKNIPASPDSAKEVEVKSIKVIQEDTSMSSFFDLNGNGKNKEEISINISPKRLKKREKQRLKAEKKAEMAREALQNRTAPAAAETASAGAAKTAAAVTKDAKPKAKKPAKATKVPKEKGDVNTYTTEFAVINAGVIAIIFLAVAFSLVFLKRSSGFSDSENRELYTFPEFTAESYFSGEFTDGITKFFTDTVPNREKLKELTKSFTSFLGISPKNASISAGKAPVINNEKFTGTLNSNNVTIYTGTRPSGSDNIPDVSGDISLPPPVSSSSGGTTPKPPNNDEIENGILVINKGTKHVRAMELYGGGFGPGKNYALSLNKYKEDLGQFVNVYNMCIPMAAAYYLPKEFSDQCASIPDNINNIRSYLNGVANVDVYSALKGHVNEYIYSRTDHHWQPLGAYYAAQEFAKTAQVDFADLDSYEKLVKDEFVGTLYGYSKEAELNKYPDTFTYYKPQNNYTTYYYNTDLTSKEESTLFFDYASGVNTYSVFLGRDNIVTEIDTDVKNGRVLVIYKDSFGNALVPFLVGSFERIYVCDYRYTQFNAVEFCKSVGATDLLFATSMFTSTSQSKVDEIENNRTK